MVVTYRLAGSTPSDVFFFISLAAAAAAATTGEDEGGVFVLGVVVHDGEKMPI